MLWATCTDKNNENIWKKIQKRFSFWENRDFFLSFSYDFVSVSALKHSWEITLGLFHLETGGGRKWPFCPRGSNCPVQGGTENPLFCPGGIKLQILVSRKGVRGGNIFGKMSEGGNIVKIKWNSPYMISFKNKYGYYFLIFFRGQQHFLLIKQIMLKIVHAYGKNRQKIRHSYINAIVWGFEIQM